MSVLDISTSISITSSSAFYLLDTASVFKPNIILLLLFDTISIYKLSSALLPVPYSDQFIIF